MRFVQFLFFRHALVHRFQNNCIIHLSANSIAQLKKPQRSPLRLRFLNCTFESVSCVDDTVIYETMHRIQIVGASHSCLLER